MNILRRVLVVAIASGVVSVPIGACDQTSNSRSDGSIENGKAATNSGTPAQSHCTLGPTIIGIGGYSTNLVYNVEASQRTKTLPEESGRNLGSYGRTQAPRAAPTSLQIPIEIFNLDTNCFDDPAVTMTGTIPVGGMQDYQVASTGTGKYVVTLSESYLDRVSSGDQLEIRVALAPKEANSARILVAMRNFTLYSAGVYQDLFTARQFRSSETAAFPLPNEETRHLFGDFVERNFYVIRISLRNNSDAERLVSSGTIVASGWVHVEGNCLRDGQDSGSCSKSAYSIPISAVPASADQMYTLLDLEQDVAKAEKDWVFRSLAFSEALESVKAASGDPAANKRRSVPTGALQALGPQSQDSWRTYMRRIVAYSMADLTLVPRHGVTAHEYLFFSKRNIGTLASDQSAFVQQREEGGLEAGTIHVEFDRLEISFRKIAED